MFANKALNHVTDHARVKKRISVGIRSNVEYCDKTAYDIV